MTIEFQAIASVVGSLQERVATLEQQYIELQNELSLIASIQRAQMDLEKRFKKLEGEARALYGFGQEPKSYEEVSVPRLYAPFGSIDRLIQQVESMFDCRDGDHRAWHSVWADNAYVQHPYTILGLLAPSSIPNAQERLRQAMYTSFFKLRATCKSKRPVLYWRYGVAERIQEDVSPLGDGELRYKIMTRIAIPEADFSVVGGMVKPDDGTPYSTLKA